MKEMNQLKLWTSTLKLGDIHTQVPATFNGYCVAEYLDENTISCWDETVALNDKLQRLELFNPTGFFRFERGAGGEFRAVAGQSIDPKVWKEETVTFHETRTRHVYLWGSALADTGRFYEGMTPVLFKYPLPQQPGSGSRVQASICEHLDENGNAVFYRMQDLKTVCLADEETAPPTPAH
jgi:hypothetical protein